MSVQVLSSLGAPVGVTVKQGLNPKSYIVVCRGQEEYGTEQFVRGFIAAIRQTSKEKESDV